MASILIELVSEPWTYMGQKKNYTSTPIKILGVVQDINGMDEPPLNVDNAIIHEEYLVELHYNYYKNDLIKRGGDFARNFVHQGFYTKHRLWLHIEDH